MVAPRKTKNSPNNFETSENWGFLLTPNLKTKLEKIKTFHFKNHIIHINTNVTCNNQTEQIKPKLNKLNTENYCLLKYQEKR